MAKTIADYQLDYIKARNIGDAAGMKAANDGANAIRATQGQATQNASNDINLIASQQPTKTTINTPGMSGSPNYSPDQTKYTYDYTTGSGTATTMPNVSNPANVGRQPTTTTYSTQLTPEQQAAIARQQQLQLIEAACHESPEDNLYLVQDDSDLDKVIF